MQNKLSSLFRLRVSESVVILTNSEMIIPGYICRGDNEVLPRLAILKSTEGVGDRGLLPGKVSCCTQFTGNTSMYVEFG